MYKTLMGIFVALVLVLSGCGSPEPEPEVFEPAYYGNDKTEQCYFVESPEETVKLKEDGLCEQDWNPAPWPEDDFAGFYPFFFYAGSGGHHYRDRYVPTQRQGNYGSKIQTFEKNPAFKSKVATLSPKAQYRSSTGKIVSGNQVKANSFGSRFQTGSGSRPKGCAAGVIDLNNVELVSNVVLTKGGGGSGGGSRGGGSSGGGSKGGSSGSKGSSGGKTGGKSGGGTAPKC